MIATRHHRDAWTPPPTTWPRTIPPGPSELVQRPAGSASRRVDGLLLAMAGALAVGGLLMVFNAAFFLGEERFGDPYALATRQAIFLVIAVALGALVSRVPVAMLRPLAYPALGFVLVLLALVIVPGIGQVRNGAQRWLPLGPVSFEPSELLKPAFVLFLAHTLARKRASITSFSFGVLPPLIIAGVPIALLMQQPDFGASAVIAVVLGAMLFVAGARAAHLLGLAGVGGALGAALVFSSDYRWSRVMAFLDPWADQQGKGFQLVQSLVAMGSGGVAGVGLGDGKQKLFYLPEGHTDFIFALIGEETGLIGGLLVLVAYGVLAIRGFRLAARAPDLFSAYLAFGLTFTIAAQAVLNLAVVMGCLPTKGMPLPLLSYGGSSLVVTVGMLAVLLSLSREVR